MARKGQQMHKEAVTDVWMQRHKLHRRMARIQVLYCMTGFDPEAMFRMSYIISRLSRCEQKMWRCNYYRYLLRDYKCGISLNLMTLQQLHQLTAANETVKREIQPDNE